MFTEKLILLSHLLISGKPFILVYEDEKQKINAIFSDTRKNRLIKEISHNIKCFLRNSKKIIPVLFSILLLTSCGYFEVYDAEYVIKYKIITDTDTIFVENKDTIRCGYLDCPCYYIKSDEGLYITTSGGLTISSRRLIETITSNKSVEVVNFNHKNIRNYKISRFTGEEK